MKNPAAGLVDSILKPVASLRPVIFLLIKINQSTALPSCLVLLLFRFCFGQVSQLTDLTKRMAVFIQNKTATDPFNGKQQNCSIIWQGKPH
jgi:hypothetical protein